MAVNDLQTLRIAMSGLGTRGATITIPGMTGGETPPGTRVESPKKKKKKIPGGTQELADTTQSEVDVEALPEEQKRILEERKMARTAPEREEATARRVRQSRRKRAIAASARRRAGARPTILTGTQGLLGDTAQRRKTLLGL